MEKTMFGVTLETGNRSNLLYLRKNGLRIIKDSYIDHITRSYPNWGNMGTDLRITLPKGEGKFLAEVFCTNPDYVTRTRFSAQGLMNEFGDVVDLKMVTHNGHGSMLNYTLVQDIVAHSEQYPKSFVRFARKCLDFLRRI